MQVCRDKGALQRSTMLGCEVLRAAGPGWQLHSIHRLAILARAQRQPLIVHQKAVHSSNSVKRLHKLHPWQAATAICSLATASTAPAWKQLQAFCFGFLGSPGGAAAANLIWKAASVRHSHHKVAWPHNNRCMHSFAAGARRNTMQRCRCTRVVAPTGKRPTVHLRESVSSTTQAARKG